MKSAALRPPLLFALLCFGRAGAAQTPAETLDLRVRDAVTGAPLPARVLLRQDGIAPGRQLDADRSGHLLLSPAPGRAGLAVQHAGYRPLESFFAPAAGQRLPVTFWLDPVDPSDPLPQARRDAALAAGRGVIHGYIRDEADGRPIAGATVRLTRFSTAGRSGADGFFVLEYSAPPVGADALPVQDELLVERAGYRRHRVAGILLHPVALRLLIDMTAGKGETREEQIHKLKRSAAEQENAQSAPHPPDEITLIPPAVTPDALQGMVPPASIRVGTTCSCSSCSGVSVMSLESYVAGGLDDEWISSWNSHSLKAGAVAYRSYGAYYVAHPISGTYDICSSTCCQVFGSGTVSATVSAANATAGFMLQKGGTIFRSEFSAENNAWDDPADGLTCVNTDLSCGDGSAGSPAASWPCVADSVCLGHGCYGHGRGECQWGTQRNAVTGGRLWNWINNFYYNANGAGTGNRTAFLTTPVTLSTASPAPAANNPGATFTINATVVNAAGLAHSQVMIGASLYSAATGYLSDPAGDTKVSLPAGTDAVSRPFTVPAGTPGGTYDLLVSLYYDVDGNNTITALDQSLQLSTFPAAVTVARIPPPVPDGAAVPGAPLKAGKNGAALHLTWIGCAVARTNIYYGPMSAVSTYGYSGSQCNIGAGGAYDWTAPAGSIFYQLVDDNGAGIESSWGLNSSGAEAGGAAASGLCGNTAKATNGTCS